MMNPNRPIDSKREEYRKYLERAGILDALTKLLSHLYEEPDKPADGLKFIYNFFGESFPELITPPPAALTTELENEREKVKQLTEQVEQLKAKLAALEMEQTPVVEKEPATEAVAAAAAVAVEPEVVPEVPQITDADSMTVDPPEEVTT